MIALVMGMGIPIAIIYRHGAAQIPDKKDGPMWKSGLAPIIGDIPWPKEVTGKQEASLSAKAKTA